MKFPRQMKRESTGLNLTQPHPFTPIDDWHIHNGSIRQAGPHERH